MRFVPHHILQKLLRACLRQSRIVPDDSVEPDLYSVGSHPPTVTMVVNRFRSDCLEHGSVVLAERVGFEPTEQQAVHRISSPAHSTTLAPLRDRSLVGAANDTSTDLS